MLFLLKENAGKTNTPKVYRQFLYKKSGKMQETFSNRFFFSKPICLCPFSVDIIEP